MNIRVLRLLFVRILNRCGRPFGINLFPRVFENSETQELTDRKGVFDQIYKVNYWGSDESKSGLGSEAKYTRQYKVELEKLVYKQSIECLFDSPCGDLNWIGELAESGVFRYIGGDISKHLIHDLRQQHPNLELNVFDICEDDFPVADVWHCRDCLFHLPFDDIKSSFDNFIKSDIPYALMTTHRALIHKNLDISAGGFRFLDLEREPFNLPQAIEYLPDYKKYVDFPRFVGLWSREMIKEAVNKWPKEA